jgi:hypothetical protein
VLSSFASDGVVGRKPLAVAGLAFAVTTPPSSATAAIRHAGGETRLDLTNRQ